jgi:hypothetical protein
MNYAEDCPSEYSLATGPLAPSLLRQLISVIEREPGVEAGKEPPLCGWTGDFTVADGFVIADGRRGRVIAIYHYDDWYPHTGKRFKLRDYLVRWDDDTHSLFEAGSLPGDMPCEKPMTLEQIFAWYQEEGSSGLIERVVVQGALSSGETDESD